MESNRDIVDVYSTKEYDMFKKLLGNRDVSNKRVGLVKACIEEVGYISNPIIVNEKKEVIDGQARLEALKQLSLPVEYRVIRGLTIDHCRAMNLKPTGWQLNDYIHSYAEQGYKDYIELESMEKTFKFGYQTILNLCNKAKLERGGARHDKVKRGEFNFKTMDPNQLREIMDYLTDLRPVQKKVGGRKDVFYSLIGWASIQPGVDKNRLLECVSKRYSELPEAGKAEAFLLGLEEIYNRGLAKSKRIGFRQVWLDSSKMM